MIEGQSVWLRPIEEADQAFLSGLANDPGVRANVVGWDFPQSVAQQSRWFASHKEESTRRWLVVEKETDLPLGMAGLWDIDWHDRNAVTGLKLGGPHLPRGRGLGRDILKTLMAFAFYDVGLHRLSAPILATNEASIRIFTVHAGFQPEGVSREHVWRHGHYCDLLWFGALKADFDSLADAEAYRERICSGRILPNTA